jgi:acyl-CoA reductase-like NAD-dependent aldehyde dehydrogenase
MLPSAASNVPPGNPLQLTSFDPATGEAVGSVPVTPVDAIPRLVHQSREAQRGWGALTHAERADVLRPAAARLKAEARRLGELASREMGKPLPEAIGEANYCADGFAGELDEIVAALADTVREDARVRSILRYAPLGVCAAIAPWNFPILMPHQSVLPALVAGNAVLLKPSEETTLVACEYAKILNEFLPTGVLTPVFGDGTQGRALVLADVDLIVFTGSRETGKRILADAGPGLKRVILELGGKDPLVVLDDADLDAAAAFGVDAVGLPFTIFTDAKGRVIALHMGELTAVEADLILQAVADVNAGRSDPVQARSAITAGLAALPRHSEQKSGG